LSRADKVSSDDTGQQRVNYEKITSECTTRKPVYVHHQRDNIRNNPMVASTCNANVE